MFATAATVFHPSFDAVHSAPVATKPAPAGDPRHLDLTTLVRYCTRESEAFYRGQPYDSAFSYELFRRALVERNDAAWEQLYLHYAGLVEGWVRRTTAFGQSGESADFFVSGAFARFWRAVTAERFADFPSLAALLNYLRLCASSVVIDSVRSRTWSETQSAEEGAELSDTHAAPETEVIDQLERAAFWQCVNAQLADEAERAVIFDSFVLGMAPRMIARRRQNLFADVSEVYNIKRKALLRLGRSNEVRRFLASEE